MELKEAHQVHFKGFSKLSAAVVACAAAVRAGTVAEKRRKAKRRISKQTNKKKHEEMCFGSRRSGSSLTLTNSTW